ncbi:MAG: type IV pilus secretin PilQ [Syntrophorhabdaceae bacterium]|nr:type IV pilus secretin PilQ [Syntrophorhabdaceae bacterium]HOC45391.1 type IV pilus secretin PilQ [Syntrophorhabdaceae bacterium]
MTRKRVVLFFLLLLIIPLLCFGQTGKKASKVSFDFMDADVRNVVRILAEVASKNIIISDAVKGKITMKLDNVYWDEALDLVIETAGLRKIEADTVIRVVTSKEYEDETKRRLTERESFRRDRLERQKMGEEFITETVYLSYVSPADMERMLKGGDSQAAAAGAPRKGFLSEYGQITQVQWNNALIIKDTKENVANMIRIVKEHDKKPNQIQIDCKIVQANTNFSRELGIQWGIASSQTSGALGNKEILVSGGRYATSVSDTGTTVKSTVDLLGFRPGSGSAIPYNLNLPAAVLGGGSGGTLGFYIGSATDSFQLDVQLSALEDEGKGRILSNPKVITSDNKKATIQQGKSIPYKTYSQSGTQTQFAEAVLGLEVTPSVTKDGFIRLEILAKKDQADFINTSEGVPTIDKKQASTLLYVKDGETAVIGGIYERQEGSSENGIPGLKNIPLLGWLFKKQTTMDERTELLIFITPRVVKNLYNEG